MSLPPFHLAIPVENIDESRQFYGDLMGCAIGRSAAQWMDFDFFGHQLVAHVAPHAGKDAGNNPVDGDHVPVPHFGVVLEWSQWQELGEKLKEGGVEFIIAPRVRFEGQPGEQGIFFIRDPSGNALEFKTFKDMSNLFSTSL